jgi:hypothetical protein
MTMFARLFAAVVAAGFGVAVGVGLVSCGSSSSPTSIPQADACNQASTAICARVFSCSDPILVAAQQFVLGGSEATCQMMIKQSYCGAFACTAGQTYHGDKAQQCKDQFATATCASLAAAATSGTVAGVLMTVPACQQVCTGGGDASTSGG